MVLPQGPSVLSEQEQAWEGAEIRADRIFQKAVARNDVIEPLIVLFLGLFAEIIPSGGFQFAVLRYANENPAFLG